ncbi:hypothetical protein OE88DRAFT_1636850 [Heliocybe sulcata]|uniref:Uncharacterized protein n=1 Tax=Heliocybe sulcata TaxID=5364 RepID=A0A5C3MPE3_9AGAM|nr:hypothetical protein OE88DRAFT_1636850 [Heliocybe sulcata]
MNATFRVSQYAPANETESDIWFERSNIDGAIVAGVGYGVHLTLFIACFSALWTQRTCRPRYSQAMLSYIALLSIMGTISFATNTRFNEMTFVDDRDYPGGPNAFFVSQNSLPVNILGDGTSFVAQWMQDGLLLWRYFLIWNCSYWALAIPGLIYLSTVVISCLLLSQIAQPGENMWQSLNVRFGITQWSLSIGLNFILTTLIVGRLLYMRRRLRHHFKDDHQAPYLSVSTMLIESALLNTVISALFLVSFARDSALQNIFLPLSSQAECIAPMLIVLRVAQGRAWSRHAVRETRTMASFGERRTPAAIALGSIRYTENTEMGKVSGPDSRSTITTSTKVGVEVSSFRCGDEGVWPLDEESSLKG